jgi:O-antigen ligase
MMEEIKVKPWLGHGTNAQEEFIFDYLGFYGQPHNDWIRLLFDYGYLGTFMFALCIVLQSVHAWRKAKGTTGETRILFYAGASSFLPFVLLMFTDNIILYVSFFGNLQFTILGLAYASLKTSMRDAAWYQYQAYLSSLSKINDSSKK